MDNENITVASSAGVPVECWIQACDLVEAPSAPGRILICPWGQVKSTSGDFVLNEESAREIEAGWREHGVDLPIDYEHHSMGGQFASPDGTARAAGWIKSLAALPGEGLFAEVSWTAQGSRDVATRAYRYLSPVVLVRKQDKVAIGLHSVALTNKPAIARMRPIVNRESNAASAAAERTESMDAKLLKLLGLAAEATEEQVANKIAELTKAGDGAELKALRESIAGFAADAGDEVLAKAAGGEDVAAIANALKLSAKAITAGTVPAGELAERDKRIAALEASQKETEWNSFLVANRDRITPAEEEDYKALYQGGHKERVSKLVANKPRVATQANGLARDSIVVLGKDNNGADWEACAEATWKAHSQIRQEFDGQFKAYKHYVKAFKAGLVRIFSPALQQLDPYSAVAVVANAMQTQYGLGSRAIIGTFYEMLEGAFDKTWASKIGMSISSTQESETYKWLGMAPALREWVGGRQAKGLRENGLTIANKLWEGTLEVGVDDQRRDKTGQIRIRIGELADRAAEHWDKLISDLINAGGGSTLGLCYDGQYFFDDDHSEGSSGSQKNLLTSSDVPALNVATATAPTPLEFAQALLGIIAYQLGLVDDQGEPANGSARSFLCMVAPSLAGAAMAAISNTVVIGTSGTAADNPLKNSPFTVDLAVNPRLTSATALIYLFRTDGRTKPFILQEEQGVKIDAVAEGSEEEFKNRRHLYGLTAIRNAGFGMWQHAAKATMS